VGACAAKPAREAYFSWQAMRLLLKDLSACEHCQKENDHEYGDEQEEEKFSDIGGGAGDASEA
jgi:hypothetical protein